MSPHLVAYHLNAQDLMALVLMVAVQKSLHGAVRKLAKYDSLAPYHTFVPVAIESLGIIGTLSMAFLKDVSRRIRQRTGEVKAHQYLLQRLLVAVQRGNAISVMGSMGGLGGPNIFSV